MSYILKQFDGVNLPLYDPDTPTGSGPAKRGAVRLGGGGHYDVYGSARAPLDLPYDLRYKATYVESSLAALETALSALRGRNRRRGRLIRELANGDTHWCVARLVELDAPRPGGITNKQQCSLTFEVGSAWYGALHGDSWYIGQDGVYLGDGHVLGSAETYTLNGSPKVITLTNGGDGDVTAVSLTLTAGAAPITAFKLGVGACEWEYNTSLAAGQALVVDGGAWSVLHNGADAFNALQQTALNATGYWFTLAPGANTVTLTYTGGGGDATALFSWLDVHE